MTEDTKYYSTTETAKLVREALKGFKFQYPGVKFSVRSHLYAGGSSIQVGWTDGPLAREVDAVVKRFEGATFDGMIDLKSYVTATETDEDGQTVKVSYGADWVFTNREMSEEAAAVAAEVLRDYYGPGWDLLGGPDRAVAVRKYFWNGTWRGLAGLLPDNWYRGKYTAETGGFMLVGKNAEQEAFDGDVLNRCQNLEALKHA
jgi:hypothetical protein